MYLEDYGVKFMIWDGSSILSFDAFLEQYALHSVLHPRIVWHGEKLKLAAEIVRQHDSIVLSIPKNKFFLKANSKMQLSLERDVGKMQMGDHYVYFVRDLCK